MGELAETGSFDNERRGALGPYLDHLSASLREAGDADGPSFPPRLDLDRWEATTVEQGLRGDAGEAGGWEYLLAEGVALQAKFLVEAEQWQDDPQAQPELLEQLRAQMEQTAAIGVALQTEIQRVVDAMIVGGDMNRAKRLTNFRNKLGHLVADIAERIGAEAHARALIQAEGLVSPLKMQTASRPRIKEPEREPPKQAKFDKYANVKLATSIEVRRKRPNRARPLLVVFAVSLAAWAIFIAPRMFRTEIPELSRAELSFSPAIQQVTARPPSLYLVVDRAEWRGMTTAQRQDLTLQVGQTAEAVGYTGVNIRYDDGTTVASWTVRQGPKLVQQQPRGES
jgi:hypothetical protein